MRPIYLDHNATTPADARVREKMLDSLSNAFGNPASRDHSFGWDAADAVEEARLRVADLIGASPGEIIFTSCATEAITWVLSGIARARPMQSKAIIAFRTEHEAVLKMGERLHERDGVGFRHLPVDRAGQVDPDGTARILRAGRIDLLSSMFANNETGVIHAVKKVARAVHETGSVLFSDLTQAAGKIPIDVRVLGIDLAAFSAHKMYGPKGVGALFIRSGEPEIVLEPLIVGGGQERGLRAGTLNVPGIVGFGEACRIAREEMADEAVRTAALRDRLEREVLAALPDVSINGDVENRLPNTSNLCFHGVDARTLIRDMHDVAVSTRSACSSGSAGPSHVLKAMGLSDDDAYASIRFSVGRFTTEQEIDHAVERVIGSVRKLRRLAGSSTGRGDANE